MPLSDFLDTWMLDTGNLPLTTHSQGKILQLSSIYYVNETNTYSILLTWYRHTGKWTDKTHEHTHLYWADTDYSHDIPVFRTPSESPNPKETKNTRGKLFTLSKNIRKRHKNIDSPVEMMNSVNLLTYFTVRPDMKLLMAPPNAHTATPNPTYLTPTHWAMKSCGVEKSSKYYVLLKIFQDNIMCM